MTVRQPQDAEPVLSGVEAIPQHDYSGEAEQLDAEILRCIERRAVPDFNELALRIFAHQQRYNAPYARYCAELGVTLDALPASWEAIPPVPAAAYKDARLCTFASQRAELVFETSGTTHGFSGKHYMERANLYDASLLAGFHDAMLADARVPLRYLLLVPNPRQRPQSSLGYMMQKVARTYGDGHEAWLLDDDALHVDDFVHACRLAVESSVAVCIAGTAFAFVKLLDALRERDIALLPLPEGSRIMETGGFKGRTRIVGRDDLYRDLARVFALSPHRIIAEYGMTELTSQYYDLCHGEVSRCHPEVRSDAGGVASLEGPLSIPKGRTRSNQASTSSAVLRGSRAHSARFAPQDDTVRIKYPPAWMRARVVGVDGKTLPVGVVGALAHVDLGNRSSCVAVQTEDLGAATEDGGIVLIGREQGAELRGCSLDAEQLRAIAFR